MNRNRKRFPRFEDIQKIAEYLDVSINFLATGREFSDSEKEKPSNLSEEQSDLLLLVAQLKPPYLADAKKALKHVLRDQEENE